MRRINYLFMLLLMFCMSAVCANAQKRYQMEGFGDEESAWKEETIQEGVPCALQNASVADYDVFNGNAKASYVGDDGVYVFEAAGQTTDGLKTFRLKNLATGKYVEDPKTSGVTTISFTDSKARAFEFTVSEAETWPSDVIVPGDGETRDWRTATSVTPALEGAVILTRSDVTETTARANVSQLLSNAKGSKPSFGNAYDKNVWVIYAVSELTGADYVGQVLNELYPNGLESVSNLYDVGDQPGQISQELYDELIAAYNNLNDLGQQDNPDQDACIAAYNRCVASMTAAKNGAVPVKEGYYYFRVHQKIDGNYRDKNAAYDNGSYIRWSYKTDWELSETPNPEDAKYIWHIIPNTKDNRGGYFIQNVHTKRYVGLIKKSDTALPTTVEAEDPWLILPQDGNKGYFTVEGVDLIDNPVIGWQSTKCTAMHCPNWTDIVVLWSNTDTDGCAWQFRSVDEDFVKQIEASTVQYDLNKNLQAAYDKAEAAYKAGQTYSINGCSGKDDLSVNGLVTSAEQISSNAPDASEGQDYGLLLDGNTNTFFHSDWHGAYDVEYHSLAVDLKNAYSNIILKMWRRMEANWSSINNGSNNPAPKVFIVYGSNEGMGEATDSIGEIACDWSTAAYNAELNKTIESGIGYCNVEAPKAYRYYTFFMKERMNGGTNKFYNLGEIRVYEGPSYYDKDKSLNEAVPEEVRNNLLSAMETAKAELEAEKATQATTDKLTAAYEEFMNNYPDPTIITKLVAEAKAQAAAADETSTEIGYFQEGAKAELEAALAPIEAQVKDVMTVAEIQNLKAQVQAALEAFNQKLILPEDGSYVLIQSSTTSTDTNPATDAYLYAANNGGARVKWATSENLEYQPNYIWAVEKSNGKFRFRNVGTGEYLNDPKTLSAAVTTSQAADTCWVGLQSAKVGGSINFVLAEGLYVNAQPNSHNVVVWNSCNGTDNSAFRILSANIELDGYAYATTKTTQVITLPIDVDAKIYEGTLYSVKGQTTDNKVYLEPLTGVIAAGTPFVFVPADDMEEDAVYFTIADVADLEYVFTPKEVNGLVGTLAEQTVATGMGKIINGSIALTTDGETVAANTGYFGKVPVISESEATSVYIVTEGELTAINNAVVNRTANSDVYTLSGVKIRANVSGAAATNGLPAGIYVVGGKKVIVK